ncbi:MAG: molybdenum cofactor guanylyltransferase [Clostridiaceae bacterium]|nr:molybdenum cofactor guanylyltransferase [Clostridiaceae bacterium]
MLYLDTVIILAGGKSSRMGIDKQFMIVDNRLLIDHMIEKLKKHFKEIIIVTNKPEMYENYPYKIVEDKVKEFGPLAGIHAGLMSSSSLYNYVLACDMPFINFDYVYYMQSLIKEELKELDAVVTRFGQWLEPFNAFYSKNLIDRIEKNILENKRRIVTLFEESEVLYVTESKAREFSPKWEMFMNLNTCDDFQQYMVMKER